MKYELSFVPPGGGETDYTLTVDNASHVPLSGEYIVLQFPDETGVRAFRALYVTSYINSTKQGDGTERVVSVQAEMIHHPMESNAHKESVAIYEQRGKEADQYPESGY